MVGAGLVEFFRQAHAAAGSIAGALLPHAAGACQQVHACVYGQCSKKHPQVGASSTNYRQLSPLTEAVGIQAD